ncbi:BTB/POZ domain-containing protein KCTD19-like [Bufo gargarizans]|uniref:BTB/POZ domain-containing protein KCTD19-like n=1 Tax=Bufo gargarizans TaxID=30331 RepID=UPI001CF53292|nr:BTB/POZ domain-containing protein KCTD19-like [Bufo gargarizans]
MAGTELLADDSEPALGLSDFFHLDVGGWVFSIPTMALARFRESVLWREVCCLTPTDSRRIFLDHDGFVFRHVHQFLLTSQLSSSFLVDIDVLYEQTKAVGLQSMTEALEKLKDEEPQQRMQTKPDMSVTEKAAINYWKTRKCSSRLCELPLKSSLFPGNQDKAPLGLLHNPFLDVLQDVPYCFLPIDMLEKYPGLLTDDNLLWFAENFALIECGCQEFRFIGNFLHTGKFFLPEKFSKFDVLEAEIKSLEIPGLLQALCTEKKTFGYVHGSNPDTALFSSTGSAGSKGKRKKATKPFYILALELLAKYPDSTLGQLSIESSVDGNKLYITGTGTLFLHVKNWMGTCRLPLTRSFLEIYALCTFLDKEDAVYQSMREAVRSYLKSRTRVDGRILCNWTADVRAFPKHQIVRVYVRSHWYSTYLKTLLKYPELLANSRKACWITCGFSLLVNGDGEMFRHILNFLRLGSLHLPSEFIEWDILCQEVTEFQIPSLVKALYECKAYRLWVKGRRCAHHLVDPKLEVMSWFSSADGLQENITVSSKGLVPDKLGELRSPAVNLSHFLHSNEGREVDETVQDCTDYTAGSESSTTISACHQCIPPACGTFLASDRGNSLKYHIGGEGLLYSGCRGEMQQDGPTVKEVMQGFTPACDSSSQHHEYSRLTQTVMQCSHPPLDDKTASNTEAPCLLIERGGLGDLGTILWVQHRPLLASDGSSTTFEDSIIYTTEMDIPRCAEGTAEDHFFLTLNMSHKEIMYARQCHSFLIGLILDCIQQGNPKPSICNVMRLVSMCWAFQIPVRQFVNNLMVPKFYKGKKHKREALLCWLEFSLPYAQRYGKCVNMMLQKGHHRSASCVTLRNLLY